MKQETKAWPTKPDLDQKWTSNTRDQDIEYENEASD